jgi:serine/threonine protein kinase
MDTILVVVSNRHNGNDDDDDDDDDDRTMMALVSGLESCRSVGEAAQCPLVNQTPQCVPPEVWKGIETTASTTTATTAAAPSKQHGVPQPLRDDLWAAGVILSVLLLQAPLFDAPLATDVAYQNVLHAAAATAAATTAVITNDDDDDDDAADTATTPRTSATRFPLAHNRNVALELLRTMLAEQPDDRLTLEQIWQHEWLVQQ